MKKLIIITIVSAVFAFLVTYIFNDHLKQKFISKIRISAIHPSDSIIMHSFMSELNYINTLPKFFASKINYLVYNTKNECANISKINNIVPLVISFDETIINIEIVNSNENSINKCIGFIQDLVKKENKRINTHLKNIYKMSQMKTSDLKPKEIIDQFNDFNKRILENTSYSLNQESLNFLFLYFINTELEEKRNQKFNFDLDVFDKFELFDISIQENITQKKLNFYLSYMIFFTLIFLIILFFNIKKKSLLIKKIDKILS